MILKLIKLLIGKNKPLKNDLLKWLVKTDTMQARQQLIKRLIGKKMTVIMNASISINKPLIMNKRKQYIISNTNFDLSEGLENWFSVDEGKKQ